jgi:para-nitrobenzyl esterase
VSADISGFARSCQEDCATAVEAISGPEVTLDLRDASGTNPAYGLSKFVPVFGDDVLPRSPLDALAAGLGADVELLIGTNREEMNLYLVSTGVRDLINRHAAERLLGASHPRATLALELYGDAKTKPGVALAAAMTDLVFRWPARQFAAAHRGRTHLYEFGWRSPACAGELGACHALELPFVFKTLASCTGSLGLAGTNPPSSLAERVHRIWVEFATDGHLAWTPYDAAGRQCMALESGVEARDPDMPVACL